MRGHPALGGADHLTLVLNRLVEVARLRVRHGQAFYRLGAREFRGQSPGHLQGALPVSHARVRTRGQDSNHRILDVGCGAANNLYNLFNSLRAARGVGTEPSSEVLKELCDAFPELEFVESDTRTLPFSTGEFDLVVVRAVLHWVDRDYVLQALGEILRVAKRYVIVSDFAPVRNLSAIYHHAPEFRTYKMSYVPLLEATGLVKCIASRSFDAHDDWLATQTSLFERIPLDQAFPVVEPPTGQER